mmetsp:Transcript_20085/g.64071  ORF Transcript_20085/g.64071 Transcript_20085/m.64071 type:complete len:333 (-) Transcript_20085:9-1007(-)
MSAEPPAAASTESDPKGFEPPKAAGVHPKGGDAAKPGLPQRARRIWRQQVVLLVGPRRTEEGKLLARAEAVRLRRDLSTAMVSGDDVILALRREHDDESHRLPILAGVVCVYSPSLTSELATTVFDWIDDPSRMVCAVIVLEDQDSDGIEEDRDTHRLIERAESARVLHRVSHRVPAASIHAAVAPIVGPLAVDDVVAHTNALLHSIATSDFPLYQQLTAPDMTAFEGEGVGHRVPGQDFHRFYFENVNTLGKHQSTLVDPKVRINGGTALITYIRLVQSVDESGRPHSRAFEETRVWTMQNVGDDPRNMGGMQWVHIHFHRSAARPRDGEH